MLTTFTVPDPTKPYSRHFFMRVASVSTLQNISKLDGQTSNNILSYTLMKLVVGLRVRVLRRVTPVHLLIHITRIPEMYEGYARHISYMLLLFHATLVAHMARKTA